MKTNIICANPGFNVGDAVTCRKAQPAELGIIDEVMENGLGFVTSNNSGWTARFVFFQDLQNDKTILQKVTDPKDVAAAKRAALGYFENEVRSISHHLSRGIFSPEGVAIMTERKAQYEKFASQLSSDITLD